MFGARLYHSVIDIHSLKSSYKYFDLYSKNYNFKFNHIINHIGLYSSNILLNHPYNYKYYSNNPKMSSTFLKARSASDYHPDVDMNATEKGEFRVTFIGAGGINFGSTIEKSPWNHSIRIENKLGPRLKVVGVIDPNPARRTEVLSAKRASFVSDAYVDTKEFNTLDEYLLSITPENKPHAVIVGSPPFYRGSIIPGKDVELTLAKQIPGVGIFIEKPISSSSVEEVLEISRQFPLSKSVVAVGYMMRYLKVVQKLKDFIKENNLTVVATIARYYCTYPPIGKKEWWDKNVCQGPIVEQATHFCDLSRYIGGNVVKGSVVAQSLEYFEKAGQLSQTPINEDEIPEERRISRVTSASWKYENGAVGTLIHGITLHGTKYQTEIEVLTDGYLFRLIDPYYNPILKIRTPEEGHELTFSYPDDDPYLTQFNDFIDDVDKGDIEKVKTTYLDACHTYDLTWDIRLAAENRTGLGQNDKVAKEEFKKSH